jgi:hypothetical protein
MVKGHRKTHAASAPGMGTAVPLLVVLPFIGVGLLTGALAAYLLIDSIRFQQRAVAVPGQVTALIGHETMTAVVEYVDATGEPRELHSGWATNPPAFDMGERVTVLHDRDDPKRARIQSFGELWGTALFTGVFALMFGGAGVAAWWFRRRRG